MAKMREESSVDMMRIALTEKREIGPGMVGKLYRKSSKPGKKVLAAL